jgi:hypothetical protein
MRMAMVTRNPLLPATVDRRVLEPFVIKMNEGVKHSLLDCPGKYTVRVATFAGRTIIDQEKVKKYMRGAKMQSSLEKAALNAHRLTEALRAQNIEAYEFHDRNESIVTVSSFNTLGYTRPDGQFAVNPRVQRTIDTYGASKMLQRPTASGAARIQARRGSAVQSLVGGGGHAKTLQGIPFDTQPVAIEVPRKVKKQAIRTTVGRRANW